VPHHLIYPLKEARPNLHIFTGIHVKRVTFDEYVLGSLPFLFILVRSQIWLSDNRATGVAFTLNPLFHPDSPTETRTVRGTQLVVLSAGSFGTPGILERSGIGGKAVLEGVGVKQRVNLPGVGENYQGPSPLHDSHWRLSMLLTLGYVRADHNNLFVPYFCADQAQTLDAIFRNDESAVEGVSYTPSQLP
jgi:alcohol oxidase